MKLAFRVLLLAAALPLFAQSTDTPPGGQSDHPAPPAPAPLAGPSPLRSAVELQYYNFGNFFQVPDGVPERNVNAFGLGYRVTWTRPANTPDIYGRLFVLRYSGGASETSYTGQLGISKYGSVHWYDIAVDHTRNGYSFEIEETRATANITSLWGHYSYRIAKDWRVGADTYLDWQRFDIDTGRESDYRSIAAVVRYTGFGDILKPRIGYAIGQRDSRDARDVLDDRYWYIQLATEPRDGLEFAIRYRDRALDYENIGREDDRGQWQLRASFRQDNGLSWQAWYRIESVDSTLPGRDFDRNTASLTLTWGF